MKPLVVVGSINVDMVLKVPRLPHRGETLGAKELLTLPGGKGANQAAAAAKLGHPTIMIGQVGTDSGADFMVTKLQETGVDCSSIRRVEGPTGTAVIMLQPDGENSIIIVGGANTAPWQLDSAQRKAITTAGLVLLQREIPEHVNGDVAKLCKSANVPVILDAGGADEPLSADVLQSISTLSPNETELARLTGMPTTTMDDVIEAASHLLHAHALSCVLVKRGQDGSLLLTDSRDASMSGANCIRQPAVLTDDVVDTTGAGDCFTAAYAVAILRGQPEAEALKFAAAAASICVQRVGAMTSLPSGIEVEQLLCTL